MLLRNTGPAKAPIQLGVTASLELPSGALLIGGGDGTLAVLSTAHEASPLNPKTLKKMPAVASMRVEGAVTSLAVDEAKRDGSFCAYVGTAACNIYRVAYDAATKK